MDVMETMAAHRERFTPNDELIYQQVTADPSGAATLSTSLLAERCGVSQPALTRFVKTLGYARYQDFRTELVAWIVAREAQDTREGERLPYFAVIRRQLDQLETLFTDAYLRDLADYNRSFDRVFAVGVTKSHQPALLLEQLMIKADRPYHAIEVGLLDEISDAMTGRDLIIVFTLSQHHPAYHVLSSTSGKVLLATATANGSLSKLADRQVIFPTATANPEKSAISPVLFNAFVELLVPYLITGQ